MKEKVLVSWSGGKDSVLALYELLSDRHYEISGLLTTLTEDYDRVSMHGVRRILLEQQAGSLGLQIDELFLNTNASNEEYEMKMKEKLIVYKGRGIESVVYGDIYLEDIRRYREENLKKIGMTCIFPIWKKDTAELAQTFIDSGFKAIITCVDSQVLDKDFAGRLYDHEFLSDLPSCIDPCGENGEFHTFVYDGPLFREKISFISGETILRDNRFYFYDLAPIFQK
jgi:uncharacterized protein (TIGR00290 family)